MAVGAAVIALLPFAYVLSASLKDQAALFSYPPVWIPESIDFGNYEALINDHPFVRWTLNTLLVAGTITAIKLIIDSMAAYALAKLNFVGKQLIFALFLATILVPIGVIIVPLFFLVRDLGWLDTYLALIVPPLANPVGIVMLRAFIMQVPAEVEQAARIDNCSPFQIYWRVILPMIRPGLVVVGLYQFLHQYTSFIWPIVAVDDRNLFVLTTGLASLDPVFFLRDWGLISAGMILTMIPISVVFLLFQRQFLGVSLGAGLKG